VIVNHKHYGIRCRRVTIAELESLVLDITQDYTDNGCRFGAKLARAVPNLFTFMRHPHMEPTNNSAGRMLRPSSYRARSATGPGTRTGWGGSVR